MDIQCSDYRGAKPTTITISTTDWEYLRFVGNKARDGATVEEIFRGLGSNGLQSDVLASMETLKSLGLVANTPYDPTGMLNTAKTPTAGGKPKFYITNEGGRTLYTTCVV